MGECEKNPKYMLVNCRKSCGTCEPKSHTQSDDIGMVLKRTAKFGPVQIAEGNHKEETLDNVKSMLEYMEKSDDYLSLPSEIKVNCRNNVCRGLAGMLLEKRIELDSYIFLLS